MDDQPRWYCRHEHDEDITDQVRLALDSDKSTIFRYSLRFPKKTDKQQQRRLQVRCSEGHLNVICVDA